MVIRIVGKGSRYSHGRTMGRTGQQKDVHRSIGRNGCGGGCCCGGCRSHSGRAGFAKLRVTAAVAAGLMLIQQDGMASAAQVGNLTGTVHNRELFLAAFSQEQFEGPVSSAARRSAARCILELSLLFSVC